ncbi:MAG: hypothetical protein QOF19_134, partial [Alphaproteobacteria bacterium]|nr:hypothetical protein [Alphaproteobacteria bacterium]
RYIASMQWTVETLNHLVDAEIEALPPLLNARLIRLMEMVENIGLEQMRQPRLAAAVGPNATCRAGNRPQ